MKKILIITALAALLSCAGESGQSRKIIDLQGQWQFAMDADNIGITQNWYLTDLPNLITLPGTMDENGKGFLNKDTTTMHLNRIYKYTGAAWYRKKVVIPANFMDKHIQLILERTKPSRVWIDSTFIGSSKLLQSPQRFDVSAQLAPGEHVITILINNDLQLTPYGNVHIYSDDTQTNWNGILGSLYLEASDKTYLSNLQVYPDIDAKKIVVKMEIANQLNLDSITVNLLVEKTVNGKTKRLKPLNFRMACQPEINLKYDLGPECSLWDEYEQPLYYLTTEITHGNIKDSQTVPFGMRKFAVHGTQFAINGRTTFLRGKHDAAVFPLTGYPPMDAEGWVRVYKIAKSYGINHYRFHSYCPPEAAFTAADREGIYLQAELPFWGGMDADSTAAMLLDEGYAMLKAYSNHPSFVMFSHGNEIWSGHDRVEQNILAFKEYDDRPLYTMGSNNNSGYVPPRNCSDFFVAARTPYNHDSTLTHTRLTQAFVDSRDGGILNTQTPSTQVKFDYAVTNMHIPVIGHEIAQYQIYPNYNEINKYTGVLRAWNLEVFRNRLQKAGMLNQNMDFHKASGAWSALCYKAEMEAAIRTKGFAGFQLLDLQDFPGQGTALVGILDAFMDSKNVITPQEWRQSCNDVVLLLEFPKYCWTNDKHFIARAVIANYSNTQLNKELTWEMQDQNGNIVQNGALAALVIETGGLTPVGEINIDLAFVKRTAKLTINISIPDTDYSNSYPVWVYPPAAPVEKPQDILVADKLNDSVLHTLQSGGKVLLFPEAKDVRGNSLPGLFPPDFWNYGMFKGISERVGKPVSPGTLGLLTDPAHPLFNAFPTDFHSNWQWFSIIQAGYCLILDHTPANYRPLVQVIDNLERNHKLGLIFEFKVGDGKLLVCMSPLEKLLDKPEAAQLYRSILNYMSSAEFEPNFETGKEVLYKLLTNTQK